MRKNLILTPTIKMKVRKIEKRTEQMKKKIRNTIKNLQRMISYTNNRTSTNIEEEILMIDRHKAKVWSIMKDQRV